MNGKAGIFFSIVFGAISFSLGLYFIKTFAFLSIIFFIGTVIAIILGFKEFKINEDIKNFDLNLVPEEIQIKKSRSLILTNILNYSIFIVVCIFIIIIASTREIENIYLFLLIPMGFGAVMTYKIFSDFKSMKTVIITLNSEGIRIKNKALMQWEDISYEKIASKYLRHPESKHDRQHEINYLLFYYKNQKKQILIDHLEIDDYQLSQYLKVFRNRYENKTINLHKF